MAEYNFQNSSKYISGVTVTEFVLVFPAYETLQSYRVCPCISNKKMCNSHRS